MESVKEQTYRQAPLASVNHFGFHLERVREKAEFGFRQSAFQMVELEHLQI